MCAFVVAFAFRSTFGELQLTLFSLILTSKDWEQLLH